MTSSHGSGSRRALPPPLTDTSLDGLIAACEADSIGTRVLDPELPAEAHLDADAAWAIASLDDPFRNVVVSARFSEADADRRIAEIAQAYAALGRAFLWWRAPFHGPADLGVRLERAGIVQVGDSPAMVLDLATLADPGPGPAGLEIRPVIGEPGLRTYLEILATEPPPAGAPPAFPPPVVEAIVARASTRMAGEPVPLRYVGWLDERPVATARLSLAGGVAGIYAIQTLPDVRGRGIGRAMTLAPLLAARGLGYRVATLQSSDLGFPVYERIGFREVFRYAIHVGGYPVELLRQLAE